MPRERRMSFAITLGHPIVPVSKKIADWRREVFLTPIDDWLKKFKLGDTMEDMKKKIAPYIILTERGLTDINMDSIKDAAKAKGIYSWHLERNPDTNWMFLIGRL